jgi:hypothetical protein
MISTRDQRTIEKYLARYAEPEACWNDEQLTRLPHVPWKHAVTIPATGEHEYLPGALQSLDIAASSTGDGILVILVLNQRESAETGLCASNAKFSDWLKRDGSCFVESLDAESTCPQSLYRWHSLDILVVDRTNTPWQFADNEGVGLARKIAADIALLLIFKGRVTYPWIHMTDADARVPTDYFDQAVAASSVEQSTPSCLIYAYVHVPETDSDDDSNWLHTVKYELWLRYYVAGLRWAGSPYAFPTIGSIPACHFLAYAQVRGFPKLMAGEDFYLLNKLAKVGLVVQLGGDAVRILARDSDRVPFGTGRGVTKIADLEQAGREFRVYHPSVFVFLRQFLEQVRDILLSGAVPSAQTQDKLVEALVEAGPGDKTGDQEYRRWISKLMTDLTLEKNIGNALQRSRNPRAAVRQFDDWFDAFRTLKLVHLLRDELFGTLPLAQAVMQSPFVQLDKANATEGDLLVAMRKNATAQVKN